MHHVRFAQGEPRDAWLPNDEVLLPGEPIPRDDDESDAPGAGEAASAEASEDVSSAADEAAAAALLREAARLARGRLQAEDGCFTFSLGDDDVLVTIDDAALALWASGGPCEPSTDVRRKLGAHAPKTTRVEIEREGRECSLAVTASLPLAGLTADAIAAALREVVDVARRLEEA